MGRILSAILAVLILAGCLCGCQSAEERYQQQLELGAKYLSEGNYEEAVIAFTAAIKIDSKSTDAYLQLADVYLALSDAENARATLESAPQTEEINAIMQETQQLLQLQQALQPLEQALAARDVDRIGLIIIDDAQRGAIIEAINSYSHGSRVTPYGSAGSYYDASEIYDEQWQRYDFLISIFTKDGWALNIDYCESQRNLLEDAGDIGHDQTLFVYTLEFNKNGYNGRYTSHYASELDEVYGPWLVALLGEGTAKNGIIYDEGYVEVTMSEIGRHSLQDAWEHRYEYTQNDTREGASSYSASESGWDEIPVW